MRITPSGIVGTLQNRHLMSIDIGYHCLVDRTGIRKRSNFFANN